MIERQNQIQQKQQQRLKFENALNEKIKAQTNEMLNMQINQFLNNVQKVECDENEYSNIYNSAIKQIRNHYNRNQEKREEDKNR